MNGIIKRKSQDPSPQSEEKAPTVTATSSPRAPGAVEQAMAENKSTFALLQDLNVQLGPAAPGNSAFLQRIRREGSGK